MDTRSFRISGWLLIITIIILLSGCKHKPPAGPPAGSFLEDIYTTANTNPDVEMFCKAMPGYLYDLEGLMMKNKYDLPLIFRASGAHYGYAFCCLEDSDKKAAAETYLKGRDLAMAELRRYSYFDQAFDDTIPRFQQALPYNFDKRNIQPLYWAALNWFGWISLRMDTPEAQADIPRVEAMLEFVNSLDRSYGNGTVHAVLAAIYALQTSTAGGEPEKARQEFENAFLYTGNSILAVHVMYAQFYATRIQDRKLFEKTLKQVIETPANQYADKTFINEVARRKASLLLANAELLFSKPQEMNVEEGTTP